MDLATFLIQVLNGVQYGLLLFLIASGLTMVFGIMGVINLAHGSFYMLGAYLALTLSSLLGNFWLALAAGVALALVFGALLEWLFFAHLYRRDHLYQVLLTYALILILEEVRSLLWGDDVHGVQVPEALDFSLPLTATLSYPVYRLAMSGLCLALAVGMYLLIAHTRLGMMIRAGNSDRNMAAALGVNIGLVYRLVFALGVALAGLAGMIAAPAASVFPGMGNQVLIVSFVVVVIGGIGSVKGAMVAALLVGLVDTFGTLLVPQLAGMAIYLLMAAVLLWRPQGMFRGT
jgi:branched-chain amino acid transport system permease protein